MRKNDPPPEVSDDNTLFQFSPKWQPVSTNDDDLNVIIMLNCYCDYWFSHP